MHTKKILLLILLLAAFLRLWQISDIPPGIYPDEAMNANDALTDFKVFYPDNNGREGLFINLISLSFLIFGVSVFSLKIVPAVFGILTVLGLYLLVKELFSKNIALLSSFFLAVSFWHINFSRIAFRAILLPFVLVFSFYFLFKGLRTKKIWHFILAGIFFGAGFYTYISFRLAILILVFFLIYGWMVNKKEFLLKALIFLFTVFVVALPIGLYFLNNSPDFIGRASPISVFAQESPLKEFAKSFVLHLGMFNFHGDGNWRHNFSGSPMLFWFIGILFLIGFILSLKSKSGKMWFLITWFFAMLLPGVLTAEGLPHSLRVIGVIPVVYIFAGLGGQWIYSKFIKKLYIIMLVFQKQKIVTILLVLVFAGIAFNGSYKYFYAWAENHNVQGAFTRNLVEIGNQLNELDLDYNKYVIVNEGGVLVKGIPMPAQTIMFIENTKNLPNSTYILAEQIDEIQVTKKTAVAFLKYDKELMNKLDKNILIINP